MLVSAIPTKFSIPFGASAGVGNIRTIPTPSQVGVQNGAASFHDGFPPNTFLPIASGGSWPFGQDFNGILNQITAWDQWLQAGGPLFYDSAFSTAIGGYPKGAVLMSTATTGLLWINLADNNTTNPDSGGTNWATLASVAYTWSAVQTFSVSPVLNLNVGLNGKDAGGTPRNLIGSQSGGNVVVNGGSTNFLVNNYANTLNNLVLTDGGVMTVRVSINAPNILGTVGTIGGLVMPGSGTMNVGGLANMVLVGGTASFVINNNANTANNLIISDAGAATVRSSLVAGGPITATAGNITSSVGRLRAGLGAYLSGDANAAVLLNDFLRTVSGGTYINERLPDGTILQAWVGTTATGGNDLITFPIAFPNGCYEVLASEGAPGGWDQGTGQLFPTSWGTQTLLAASFRLYCANWNGTHYAYGASITYRYIAIGF